MTQMFRSLDRPATRTIEYQGQAYLFFGGTAYLGLNMHPGFHELYRTGLSRYGLNVGTSRSNNVQLGIYEEAEYTAAERFGFESAMILSSGFLASQLAVSCLGREMPLIYSPDTHPALWKDHMQPPASERGFSDWVAETVAGINRASEGRFVVVSNTVDNLNVAVHDFSGFAGVDRGKEVYFILDDSHGIGVLPGSYTIPHRPDFHTVVVASLAKGMGIDAGLVLAESGVIEMLRSSGIYLGASPPSPASLYAFIHGQEIYARQRALLQANVAFFQQGITVECQKEAGYPVVCFKQEELYEAALESGIVISSFPYPLPSSPLLNRVVLSSLHTQEDITRLLEVINRV